MKKAVRGKTVVFTFDNLPEIVFDPAKASEANREYAQMHGWMAAIGDKAAIQKSSENNFVVTEAMRRDAILDAVTFYEAGGDEWTRKTKAKSSVTAQSFNAAIQMIAELRGCTYDEAKVWFDAKNAATPKAEEPAPV